jgi:hypothetical protein
MALDIYIHDRDWAELKPISQINTDTIELLTEVAEKENLKCARYIYYLGNTIFNQKQMPILKKEIEQLNHSHDLNKNDLELILNSIAIAQQDKSK